LALAVVHQEKSADREQTAELEHFAVPLEPPAQLLQTE